MFLDANPDLKEAIALILSRKSPLSALQLRELLKREHNACSLQAVYKALGHLLEAGAVLKVRDRYALALPWIFKLLNFAETLSANYLLRATPFFVLPARGQKQRLVFNDIRRSDQFWMLATLRILYDAAPGSMFQWLPHSWHRLIYGRVGTQFEEALRFIGAKDYIIVGGETYLDRQACRSWPADVFVWSSAEGPFEQERTSYVSLLDDYVITTKYEAQLAEEIDRLYRRTKADRDIKAGEVLELFNRKTRVVVTLECQPQKAARLRRKFVRYFGDVFSRTK